MNSLLVVMFLLLEVNMFHTSLCLSSLNKTLLNMPKAIFEVSVPIEEGKIYFDKSKLETLTKEYFTTSLAHFIPSYNITFYYYDTKDDLVCKTPFCDGVEITLSSDINLYHYEKTMFYEIKRNVK